MRKNKKLMLGAIAAMGVMAMGVGGVGTFAWYSIGNSTAIAGTDAGEQTMTVTKQDRTANEVTVPIEVSVTTATDQSKLVLAHYNSSATTENKKLSSGYFDENHVFQEELDPTKFLAGALLYGELQIKVAIDWSVVYEEGVTSGWTGGNIGGGYSYSNKPTLWKTAAGVETPIATILSSLAEDDVKVGIKQVAVGGTTRGRVFETDSTAKSGDPFYTYDDSGTATERSAEGSGDLNGYVQANAAASLDGIGSAAVSVMTLNYYAYGGGDTYATDYDGANNVQVKFEAKVA